MGAFGSTREIQPDPQIEQNIEINEELENDLQIAKKVHKILLLGAGSAGKSTIFKQLNRIYGPGITEDDKKHATQYVYDAILDQMKNIIISCKEEYEFKLDEEIEKSAQFIERLPRDIPINAETGKHITKLWNDKNIKTTFIQRSNLGIADSTPYFLDDIERISKTNYIPTKKDILLANIPTTGIREASFEVGNNIFEIYDTGGQRSERSKWIHTYDNAHAVIYVTPLSCYDQLLYEEGDVNAMDETIQLFGDVVNSEYFTNHRTSMILFLNKLDLFEYKIEKVSLTKWDKKYNGKLGDLEGAIEYIKNKHLEQNKDRNRKIYVHLLSAVYMEEVKSMFDKVQKTIVNNALTKNGIL